MARWHRWGAMALLFSAAWGCGKGVSLEGQAVNHRGRSLEAEKTTPPRFAQNPEGVISDQVTGLEWYVCPQPDNTWGQAKTWTETLAVAGGGWRLPALGELKALYQKGASPVHMDPLFQIPGAWVWSGQLHDPSFAWGFAFYSGQEGWHSIHYGYGRGVLAVRPRQ